MVVFLPTKKLLSSFSFPATKFVCRPLSPDLVVVSGPLLPGAQPCDRTCPQCGARLSGLAIQGRSFLNCRLGGGPKGCLQIFFPDDLVRNLIGELLFGELVAFVGSVCACVLWEPAQRRIWGGAFIQKLSPLRFLWRFARSGPLLFPGGVFRGASPQRPSCCGVAH